MGCFGVGATRNVAAGIVETATYVEWCLAGAMVEIEFHQQPVQRFQK